MAVTLKTRSGVTFQTRVRFWQPGKLELVNTDDYVARVQIRSAQQPGRIVLNAHEWRPAAPGQPAPSGTVLERIGPGDWRLSLSAGITRTLPSTCRLEVELQNKTDPDDTRTLLTGVLLVEPQVVSNV